MVIKKILNIRLSTGTRVGVDSNFKSLHVLFIIAFIYLLICYKSCENTT